MSVQSERDQTVLHSLFTRSQPLGPASLDEMSRSKAAVLFDGDNEVDAMIRRSAPVFLVGRRGSGKTAFLKATTGDEGLTVDLNSPELIAQVARTLKLLDVESTGEFTERVVPVWEACFTAGMCASIWVGKYSRLTPNDCPLAFEFGRRERAVPGGFANDAATTFLSAFRQKLEESHDYSSIQSILDSVELNGVPLWLARQELEATLLSRNLRVIISFDSLDQYQGILFPGGLLQTNQALALQGLFRTASRRGRAPDSVYKVRVTFPAELWHFYYHLSANPLKDFDNTALLHWDNKELLHISSVRFLKYLGAEFPSEYRRIVPGADFSQRVLLRYLPTMLTNTLGQREQTIVYLLRHTQLLPRHFIHILNSIFADFDLTRGPIPEAHIRKSVERAENTILKTVISSFELVYPALEMVCASVIPRLASRFSYSDLQHALNQVSTAELNTADSIRMLVEVGAIGRIVDETTMYLKADFEYLHVHRLHLGSDDDSLCLHPLFSKGFDAPDSRVYAPRRSTPPVQPLGSDPSAPDEYRRLIHLTAE